MTELRIAPVLRWALLSAVLLVCFSPLVAEPVDVKLEARLIWGTNDEQSPNPKHKPVDVALTKTLRKVFKWKNYFEENRQNMAIPLNDTRKASMSQQCALEVKNLGNSRVEVKLFGSGKQVARSVQMLPDGDWLTLAGADKNDTAWFVVIRKDSAK